MPPLIFFVYSLLLLLFFTVIVIYVFLFFFFYVFFTRREQPDYGPLVEIQRFHRSSGETRRSPAVAVRRVWISSANSDVSADSYEIITTANFTKITIIILKRNTVLSSIYYRAFIHTVIMIMQVKMNPRCQRTF